MSTNSRESNFTLLRAVSVASLLVIVLAAMAVAGAKPIISMTVYDGPTVIGKYVKATAFGGPKAIHLGGGRWITLTIKNNGPDNCPGSAICTPGSSTQWEVVTGNTVGIPAGSIMYMGIGTPGEICESQIAAGYTLDQDCPTHLYIAHGPAMGARVHLVEFLGPDTLLMGSCCGDFTDAECISWVTEELCLELEGSFNGEGSDCITGPCGPEATVPAISEWGWAGLVAIFVAGGTFVLWQRRRRDA